MNKIVIDKNFFNLNSPVSKGLISGLKKLQQYDFIIQVNEYDVNEKNELNKILDLEEIIINNEEEKVFHKIFAIDTSSSKNKDAVIVTKTGKVNSFKTAVDQVIRNIRSSKKRRTTKETNIEIEVFLDGTGKSKISTGIGFFDHMLEQIVKHANLDLIIKVKGDLYVDEHHTVEDVGITLGETLSCALGNKKGIKRYGYFLPMDDSVANCTIDLGGRSYLNFKCKFEREKVGEFPTELTEEFFRGLASGLKANIYIRSKGKNDHHKIESIFKAFAKALNEACRIDERSKGMLPSTKGIL